MTSIPEISARGSLILWAQVSDTCRPPIRQGGRDMSAPRPFETYPFHPPSSVRTYTKINFYIYTKPCQLFLPCGIYIVSWNIAYGWFTHAPFENHLFQGSAPFWSYFNLASLLKVICTMIAPYNPLSHWPAERFVLTFKQFLRQRRLIKNEIF